MMRENKKLVPKRRFKEFQNAGVWKFWKLGNVADIVRGASPRPIQDKKWFDEKSEIGWLRISDVTEQNGRIHYLEQHISKLGQEKTRVITTPHLLLSIAATVGKPVINYVSTGVHDGFLIFQNPKFDQEFMFQWLEMFRLEWQKYGQPGSQVNLNSDLIKNQIVPLPDTEEQKKISKFLNTIDTLITLHQCKIEKIKALKSAYLCEMFPADGESNPRRRFKGFTDDWEQRKLGEVAEFSKGNGYSKADLTDHGTPIILYGRLYTNYETVIQNVSTYAKVKEQSVFSHGGEVIVPSSGETAEDISRASVVEQQGIILGGDLNIVVADSMICPTFLAITISNGNQQKELSKRAQGKSVVHLNNSDLKEVLLQLPSLSEQTAIGNFFRTLDTAITLHQRKLEKLKSLKSAYLNEMFPGGDQ